MMRSGLRMAAGRVAARLALAALSVALVTLPAVDAVACFGTRLRIEVPSEASAALAAFAAGYFIQEKTGIEPEFVEAGGKGPADASVDLRIAPGRSPLPPGHVARPAGEVPGAGVCQFWIRADVLDDLRFSTVDRALAKLPAFYGSAAFRGVAQSPMPPRKAARKAVLDAN